jgi:hypothetical protein
VARIEGELLINRSVEEVFDFVADERNEPYYNPRLHDVEQVTPGAIGLGTQFRAKTTVRGRTVPMVIEFTAYDRPRRFGSVTHMATMDIEGGLSFETVPEGTRMRWSWELEPRGIVKLMTPLVAWMGQRSEKAIWSSLKHLLETPTPQS